MKINIDMENLNEIIKQSVEENSLTAIKKCVEDVTKSYVDENLKEQIQKITGEKMCEFVDSYIHNATITVGGGFYSKEEAKTYTVEEYIKHELAESMKNGQLTIKEKDRYGDYKSKTISFEDYIKQNFNAEEFIKPQLDKFIKQTRDNINQNVKETFDNTTKEMLSSTVLNVLMQSDTYAKINNAVKGIANGK